VETPVKKPAKTELDLTQLAALQRLREQVSDRVCSVALGYHTGAYISGRTGTGKTFLVEQTLRNLNIATMYRNARITALGLFRLMETHRQHVIVLDDIPALVKDPQALPVLLAALGGMPGSPRTVTYTTGAPDGSRSFQFSGALVLIGNVPLRRDPLVDAFRSRVPVLEFDPSDEMLFAFARDLSSRGYGNLTPAKAMEASEFVIDECRSGEYRFNLRMLFEAFGDYQFWQDHHPPTDWRDLVRSSLHQVAASFGQLANRANTKEHEQAIAKELFERFPTDRERREKDWTAKTKKSPHTLYRRWREVRGIKLL
jgi:hypothetical protein